MYFMFLTETNCEAAVSRCSHRGAASTCRWLQTLLFKCSVFFFSRVKLLFTPDIWSSLLFMLICFIRLLQRLRRSCSFSSFRSLTDTMQQLNHSQKYSFSHFCVSTPPCYYSKHQPQTCCRHRVTSCSCLISKRKEITEEEELIKRLQLFSRQQ